MLQMTPEAAAAINRAREREGLPAQSVVRIFAAGGPDSNGSAGQSAGFGLGFVPGPQAGDAVGEVEGTTYCVAPEVADTLDDVVLDVAEDGLILTRGA